MSDTARSTQVAVRCISGEWEYAQDKKTTVRDLKKIHNSLAILEQLM